MVTETYGAVFRSGEHDPTWWWRIALTAGVSAAVWTVVLGLMLVPKWPELTPVWTSIRKQIEIATTAVERAAAQALKAGETASEPSQVTATPPDQPASVPGAPTPSAGVDTLSADGASPVLAPPESERSAQASGESPNAASPTPAIDKPAASGVQNASAVDAQTVAEARERGDALAAQPVISSQGEPPVVTSETPGTSTPAPAAPAPAAPEADSKPDRSPETQSAATAQSRRASTAKPSAASRSQPSAGKSRAATSQNRDTRAGARSSKSTQRPSPPRAATAPPTQNARATSGTMSVFQDESLPRLQPYPDTPRAVPREESASPAIGATTPPDANASTTRDSSGAAPGLSSDPASRLEESWERRERLLRERLQPR